MLWVFLVALILSFFVTTTTKRTSPVRRRRLDVQYGTVRRWSVVAREAQKDPGVWYGTCILMDAMETRLFGGEQGRTKFHGA